MIYFDSTYIAKVYLFEPGSVEVRALTARQPEVACGGIGQMELASMLHRKLREGALDTPGYLSLCRQFEQDLARGVWHWFAVASGLLELVRLAYRSLPTTVFLRASDALHLVTAREHGFTEVYSNDRHLIAAAPHFGLKAINVIPAATN